MVIMDAYVELSEEAGGFVCMQWSFISLVVQSLVLLDEIRFMY